MINVSESSKMHLTAKENLNKSRLGINYMTYLTNENINFEFAHVYNWIFY